MLSQIDAMALGLLMILWVFVVMTMVVFLWRRITRGRDYSSISERPPGYDSPPRGMEPDPSLVPSGGSPPVLIENEAKTLPVDGEDWMVDAVGS